jgi:RecG-like helicase
MLSALRERIFASRAEVESRDLQDEFAGHGAVPIAECAPGQAVDVLGTVRSITLLPFGSTPRFEIELFDGTGTLTIIWLGRRRILGIEPGRRIMIHGRLTCTEQHPKIFNPRYELRPNRHEG